MSGLQFGLAWETQGGAQGSQTVRDPFVSELRIVTIKRTNLYFLFSGSRFEKESLLENNAVSSEIERGKTC